MSPVSTAAKMGDEMLDETWSAGRGRGGGGVRHYPNWIVATVVGVVVAFIATGALAFAQTSKLSKTRQDLQTTGQTLTATQGNLSHTQSQLSDTEDQLSSTKSDLISAQSDLASAQADLGQVQAFASACESAFGGSKEAMADVLRGGLFWLDQAVQALKRVAPDIARCNNGA